MNLRTNIAGDVFGGVTAGVVMLPMALAFGVASGLGPVAGIYGAVAVGFLAAVLGGTPAQISGPTGPMTVAMAAIVTLYADNLATAFTIVMLAGTIQVALGMLRIGSFVSYTPYSVISGFMTGIGIIIMILQVIPFLGAASVAGGPLTQIAAWPDAFQAYATHDVIVGALALGICVLWPRRLRRMLPAPLAALVIGTGAGMLVLNDARTIGAIPAGLPTVHAPTLEWGSIWGLLQPALIVALLGSIDSLLTSLVADSQTRTRHDPNREIVGQGVGNLAAGVLGALPGAGATMGTVTSIKAGGHSPLAGALAAALLLALLLGCGWIAEPVPLAVLAGILMKVGWDIIDWRFVMRLTAVRAEYALIMLGTFVVTVCADLVTGVALGLIGASLVRSRDLGREELDSVLSVPIATIGETTTLDDIDPARLPVGLVKLWGRFSIGSSNELTRAIAADIEDHDVIILDFSETTDVDDSAALAIGELIETALDNDTECIVAGLREDVAKTLNSLLVLRRVQPENIATELDEAKQTAAHVLKTRRPKGDLTR